MKPQGSGSGSKPRPAPSSLSLRSDRSKALPMNFRDDPPEIQSLYNMEPRGSRPGSKPRPEPAPRSLSLKSDRSKALPINFRDGPPEDQSLYNMKPQGSGSGSKPRPAPSSLSLRSDRSKALPMNFRDDPPEIQRDLGPKGPLDAILRRLEEDVLTFVKEQLQRLNRFLASDYPEFSESEEQSREVLNIALDFLKRMKQEELVQRLQNNSDLQEFDLRKYQASEKALLGLLPVVKASTKALLSFCGLSPHSCGPLASVLISSSLTHLDLSNNDLQDSGVELLCSGLKSVPCGLHTLRLSGCLISERGGAALASALSPASSHLYPAPSHLRELDLSYNHPGGSAALLMTLQEDPYCPLQALRLEPAGEMWMVPGLRKYLCRVSVLLDSEAGSLSFFHVKPDGELSHLHTCTSSFTEPVFPGFGLWCDGSSVSVSVTDHRRAPSAGLK
uniref:Uncharacterized protein n=1 Tax=Knipowitschia caucasica TaxID=637954 RepID=A0AAV2MFS2_KNICA